ncbi:MULTISPECIES: molybdenum cofactor biosynthesis protein MoaE [unclassified Pseudomonas]|uniref:molybdenum cofactor biosynthesis protein MoaE n=1 Tax=unclassified Pseudomonas TaxID=196821 RepID=UPI00244AB8C5|nr:MULTISPECIES: molybdenum cofactor biosynthesis protein MoaE [unclassified Pseudomonas]MDG9926807.1 molybdenum cofactor biosynthesis protein MoaE [Pseudomonas sp. GD04042]MDH0484387.1 molybdenum cofactor biosynthesis protein MoaE [Pseudomonas sp. GD04015]MDH0606589.1 molybdenum cofactor biosynthesis protein MoaE [Pseudomonas sp. GD03869]
MAVSVQAPAFDPAGLLEALQRDSGGAGAVVVFVGLVRDFNHEGAVGELYLEHYPGMTEKALLAIEREAHARWSLLAVEIVHRFGPLAPAEPIVFVGVGSAHRQAAFEGCAYIMDQLKTRAPFWKKESHGQGGQWVEARPADQAAARRWSR